MQEEQQKNHSSQRSDDSELLLDNRLGDRILRADQPSERVQSQKQGQIQLEQSENQQSQIQISKLGGFQFYSDPLSQGRDFENDDQKKNEAQQMNIDQTYMEEKEYQMKLQGAIKGAFHENQHNENKNQNQFEDEIRPVIDKSLYKEDLENEKKHGYNIEIKFLQSDAQSSNNELDNLNPTENTLKQKTARTENKQGISFDQLERKLLHRWDLGAQKVQNIKNAHRSPSFIEGPSTPKNPIETLGQILTNRRNESQGFEDYNHLNLEEITAKIQSNQDQKMPKQIENFKKIPEQQTFGRQKIAAIRYQQKPNQEFSNSYSHKIRQQDQLRQLGRQSLADIQKDQSQTPKKSSQGCEKRIKRRSKPKICFKRIQKQSKLRKVQEVYYSDSCQQSPLNYIEKLSSQSKILNSEVKKQSQSKFSLSKEEYEIFKEGFQVDHRTLTHNFFSSFTLTFNYLLLPYLGHERTQKIMKSTSNIQDSNLSKEKVLELMQNPELQLFWKIVFKNNAIQKVYLKISKRVLKVERSKLAYLFKYMFDNKKLESFSVEKEKLIQAALELKAMREKEQFTNKALGNLKSKKGSFKNQKKEAIISALERNRFDIEPFLDQFKNILLDLVRDGVQNHKIRLSSFSPTRIDQIEKKQGLSIKDCNFLLCHWQFCPIWPKVFEQDKIMSIFVESVTQRKVVRASPKRIQEYKILTVLFQKAYLEGKLTNIYVDQNLLLQLANMIQYKTKSQYFEKMPRQFWENFNSVRIQMKRQQQSLQTKKKQVKKKKKEQKWQRINYQNTINKGINQPIVPIKFEEFRRLFRILKQRIFDEMIKQNPGKGYDVLFQTKKINGRFGREFRLAFEALFRKTLTEKQIEQDSNLQMAFQKYYLSSQDYYLLLFHPLIQSRLSQVFQEGNLYTYIDMSKSQQDLKVYKSLSNLFKLAWEKSITLQSKQDQ